MASSCFLITASGLVFIGLADRARVGIDQPHQLDERIVRCVDGRLPAIPELVPQRDVLQRRAADEVHRQLARRLLAEHLVHEGVVGAEQLAQLGEAERQLLDLQVVVDRRGGEELLGHRGQHRIAELGEALAIRLGQLVGAAHQRAGDLEVGGAEPAPLLHVAAGRRAAPSPWRARRRWRRSRSSRASCTWGCARAACAVWLHRPAWRRRSARRAARPRGP